MTQEDLKKIRDFYKVSKKEISIILGLGENTWRNYEKDIALFENMSRSNSYLIECIRDPRIFLNILWDNKSLKEKLGLGRFYDIRNFIGGKEEMFKAELKHLERDLVVNFYKKTYE